MLNERDIRDVSGPLVVAERVTDPPALAKVDAFEEYKFFVDHTQRLSDRRQQTSQFFVAVHSVIFVVLSFIVRDAELGDGMIVLISAPILVIGVLSSLMWQRMIERYRTLIKWRYEQLQAMEQSPEMAGSQRFFTREWEELFKPRSGSQAFSFSAVELSIPRMMMLLYVMYLTGVIMASVW